MRLYFSLSSTVCNFLFWPLETLWFLLCCRPWLWDSRFDCMWRFIPAAFMASLLSLPSQVMTAHSVTLGVILAQITANNGGVCFYVIVILSKSTLHILEIQFVVTLSLQIRVLQSSHHCCSTTWLYLDLELLFGIKHEFILHYILSSSD